MARRARPITWALSESAIPARRAVPACRSSSISTLSASGSVSAEREGTGDLIAPPGVDLEPASLARLLPFERAQGSVAERVERGAFVRQPRAVGDQVAARRLGDHVRGLAQPCRRLCRAALDDQLVG